MWEQPSLQPDRHLLGCPASARDICSDDSRGRSAGPWLSGRDPVPLAAEPCAGNGSACMAPCLPLCCAAHRHYALLNLHQASTMQQICSLTRPALLMPVVVQPFNSILPEPMHGPAVAWWRLSTWWRLSHVLQQDSSGWDALLPAGCVCLALQPSCHGVLLHVSWLRQLLARPSNLLRLAAHRLHISQLEHRLLWLGGPMELLLCHSRRHLRWTHFAVPARAVDSSCIWSADAVKGCSRIQRVD